MKKYINKIKRNLPVINLLLIIILFYLFNYKNPDPLVFTSSQESNVGEVMGAIKPHWENGEWRVLNDDGHEAVGMSNMVVFPEYIEVQFDHEFEKIITSAVTPDEALVLEGINVGTSIDLDKMRIFVTRNGKIIDPQSIKSNDKNIWIYVKGKLKDE